MKQKIIDTLIAIGAVKFGEFTLKSGLVSPIYIDLRIIISYPLLLKDIAVAFVDMSKNLEFSKVAGIPYTALPIATAMSLTAEIPMIYARKEKKAYGTGKQIEGVWEAGDRVLIIDDLITKGTSKAETFAVFESAGLVVEDVVVLIDREQGGKELLAQTGHRLHSLISVFEILDRLKALGKIAPPLYDSVLQFLHDNR